MAVFAQKLQIRTGITAIIGSGGKTSLLYRLAAELSHSRVIVTTSTHIWKPAHLPYQEHIEEVRVGQPVCTGTPCENGKLSAPQQHFDELAALADYVLVEADGSKGRPLKAHEPQEPVLPKHADQVIAVLGLSGLGQRISEAAHRPALYARLADTTVDATVTAELAAKVLNREALHTRVLLNQAEGRLFNAKTLAAFLSCPVVIASLQEGEILCSF